MVYSDVVKLGLILPIKKKYNWRDVDKVLVNSLFNSVLGKTLDIETAVFIVKCSAVFHKMDYSNSINIRLNRMLYPKMFKTA